MGNKVNPNAIRMGITRQSSVNWFAKKREYAKYLKDDIIIRKYIKKELNKSSGVSKVVIVRDGLQVSVNIHTSRPGIIIGKAAQTIDKYKRDLCSMLGYKNLKMNVQDVKKSSLDAQIMADNIALQLEKRASYKRCMKKALQEISKAGAVGVKIQVSGRLSGAEIARTEYVKDGQIPLHTFSAEIDYATSRALTTYGIIGVKIWINRGIIIDQLMHR